MTRPATYTETILSKAMDVLRKQHEEILAENPDDIEAKFTRELRVCERVSELLGKLFVASDWSDINDKIYFK